MCCRVTQSLLRSDHKLCRDHRMVLHALPKRPRAPCMAQMQSETSMDLIQSKYANTATLQCLSTPLTLPQTFCCFVIVKPERATCYYTNCISCFDKICKMTILTACWTHQMNEFFDSSISPTGLRFFIFRFISRGFICNHTPS